MKKGIVEMADLVVVNKADGALLNLANHAKVEYMHALQLLRHKNPRWTPLVQTCSSVEPDGSMAKVWQSVCTYRTTLTESGDLHANRQHQRRQLMWTNLNEELLAALRDDTAIGMGGWMAVVVGCWCGRCCCCGGGGGDDGGGR